MRNPSFDRAVLFKRFAAGLMCASAIGALVHCTDREPSPTPSAHPAPTPAPLAVSATALARIASIRSRVPGALPKVPGASTIFQDTLDGRIHPTIPAGGRTSARVELPARATGAVRLRDEASQMEIGVSLDGAAPAAITVADGLALYPGAAPSGGDILHRVDTSGVEDLVFFAEAPEQPELRYRLDVRGVAGLRLVSNTLELLDRDGIPRLRAAPPFVLDAQGRHVAARIAIEGCAASTDARPPVGRPVVAPGAPTCMVKVTWAGGGVAYPILVDPQWSPTTTGMIQARTRFTMTLLDPTKKDSPALLAGGYDLSGNALQGTEIYYPASRVFVAQGGLIVPRGEQTATLLPGGNVLIAGGRASVSGTPLGTTEIYDPTKGTSALVTPDAPEPVARFDHTATRLEDGRVLVAGGTTTTTGLPTNVFSLYTPVGAFSANGTMKTARAAHTASILPNGQVLVSGGVGTAGFALSQAELFDPATNQFTPVASPMTVGRALHTATELSSGDVLLAGGVNVLPGPGVTWGTAEIFSVTSGSFNPVSSTMVARARHSATLLPDGQVLLAGGFSGTEYLASVEVFSPATGKFGKSLPPSVTVPALAVKRAGHAALLVNPGDANSTGKTVLVAGGSNGDPSGQALSSAELLVRLQGEACGQDGECLSGHCTDKVCCDTACDQPCRSCLAKMKGDGSRDGACGLVKEGTDLGWKCVASDEIEIDQVCAKDGSVIAAAANLCTPNTCDSAGYRCSRSCPCSDAGFCSDAGTEDASTSVVTTGVGTTASASTATASTSATTATASASAASSSTGAGGAGTGGTLPSGTGGMGGAAPGAGGTGGTNAASGSGGAGGMGGGTATTGATGGSSASGLGGASTASSAGGSTSASSTGGGTSPGSGGSGTTAGTGGIGGSSTAASSTAGSGAGPIASPGLVCELRRGRSQQCTFGRQCATGNCVDGVCCDTACEGQCQACDTINNVGTCTNVGVDAPEPPHPNSGESTSMPRPPCAGTGTTCSGFCQGKSASACIYPGAEMAFKNPVCAPTADGFATTTFLCDGKGAEQASATTCSGFVCQGPTACKTECATDDDCIPNFICNEQKICEMLTGPRCDGDHTIKSPGPTSQDCSPFKCSGAACKSSCASIDDCVAPAVCGTDDRCESPPPAPVLSACSATPGASSTTSAPWLATLAALALAGRKRFSWRWRSRTRSLRKGEIG